MRLLRTLFIGRKDTDVLAEEAMKGQLRTILGRLLSKPVNVLAILLFFFFLIGVIVGPFFNPLEVNYQDMTQQNIAPGMTMLAVPKRLKGHAAAVSAGSSYGMGLSDEGEVFLWGKTRVTKNIDLKKSMPENMGKVRMIAAGFDHAVAVNEEGEVFCWGNNRLKQCDVPRKTDGSDFVFLAAGYQFTVAVTSEGEVITWGNTNMVDMSLRKVPGPVEKVVFTLDSALALLRDGSIVYLGKADNALSRGVPEGKFADLAALCVLN